MTIVYWIGGVLGIIIAISLLVRWVTFMVHNSQCRKGWESFAQAHGLRLESRGFLKGPLMKGSFNDHDVEVSLERKNVPIEGFVELTMFRAFLPSPLPCELAIGHRSTKRFLSKAVKTGSFVKIGNTAYDGYLRARTDDPNRVKALFEKEGGGEFFSHFVAGRSLAMATSKGVEFAFDEMEIDEKRLEVGLKTVTEALETFQDLIKD